MDIKLKKFNGNQGFRAFVFIICVVFFIGTLTVGTLAVKSMSELNVGGIGAEDVFLSKSYVDSAAFQRQFVEETENILYMIGDLKGEEYIKEGKTIDRGEIEDLINRMFYSWKNDRAVIADGAEAYNDAILFEQFKEECADEIDEAKNRLILNELKNFEMTKESIDKIQGLKYYASDGVYTITNLTDDETIIETMSGEFFKKTVGNVPGYLIYEYGKMDKFPTYDDSINRYIRNYDNFLEDRIYNQDNSNYKIYFAYEQSFIENKQVTFNKNKADLYKWIPIVAILALITIAAFIWLMAVTGRKDDEGNRKIHPIDRIFTEIQLVIIVSCFIGGGYIFFEMLFDSIRYSPYHLGVGGFINTFMIAQMGAALLAGLAAATIGLLFVLSCARNLKSRRFFNNFLIYKATAAVIGGIRTVYLGGSVMRKVVLITLAVCLLSATVVMAPVVAILILILAPKWVRKYEEIRKGVKEVKNGNLTYKIPVLGQGELDGLSEDINEISEASHMAIQNELKNQRLKTDLISNVSHDLKTPLTSIITYIDLLKTEGMESENAPQYLEVLDLKSRRLQKLTEDLFDAAKASSGAIPVKMETVDMLALINQGLGEMAARIEGTNLDFIVNATKEKYLVDADGQLLWRVVENLLGNVLKYALEGSRVYIDLKETEGINGRGGQIILEIKNISKDKLNIEADELMERFKRGDIARSTEGSGLGLAIARDLVQLQKGWFEIKIDGDLFKAVVMLPAA